jgi:hypothetical protein
MPFKVLTQRHVCASSSRTPQHASPRASPPIVHTPVLGGESAPPRRDCALCPRRGSSTKPFGLGQLNHLQAHILGLGILGRLVPRIALIHSSATSTTSPVPSCALAANVVTWFPRTATSCLDARVRGLAEALPIVAAPLSHG